MVIIDIITCNYLEYLLKIIMSESISEDCFPSPPGARENG